LLLKTNGGINEQCLQWVPCIPGTTAGCFFAGRRNLMRGGQEGLIGCPFQDDTKKEGANIPLSRLEDLRSDRKF